MNTHELLDKAWQAHEMMQSVARDELAIQQPIDEIALLFARQSEMLTFAEQVKLMGGARIGSVPNDTMVRQDQVNMNFNVRFEFVRIHPEWRIEAMCVLWGKAPLHTRALELYGSGCIVHASYKLQTRMGYDQHTGYGYDVRVLNPAGCMDPADIKGDPAMEAEYQNSYGRFSYWQHGTYPFLKPRVNLRDPQPQSS